jgi:hypothetical protein
MSESPFRCYSLPRRVGAQARTSRAGCTRPPGAGVHRGLISPGPYVEAGGEFGGRQGRLEASPQNYTGPIGSSEVSVCSFGRADGVDQQCEPRPDSDSR